MLTVLVLAPPAPEVDALAETHPSVEILRAHDVEEALEKLGRNRRIDAVLVAGQAAEQAADAVLRIHEDNPAPPPIFVPVTGAEELLPAGGRRLPPGPIGAVLEALIRQLTAED